MGHIAVAMPLFHGESLNLRRQPYLTSAGPRQVWVWGSRTRPLPQPSSVVDPVDPDTLGVGDATPVVCALWKAGLVWNDPAALLSDQVIAVAATSNSKKLMRHIELKVLKLKVPQINLKSF
jgi:hypothetical protein